MGAFLFITMRENPSVQAFKIWIFPSLVSLLGLVIWSDVKEVKADVKALMAQSNIDKTEIQNLKKEVDMLEQSVFNKRITSSTQAIDFKSYRDKFFKHEEIFDVTKYIPKS